MIIYAQAFIKLFLFLRTVAGHHFGNHEICSTFVALFGEMAEWSIAAVLKTVVPVTGPGVRIPLSPPVNLSGF